MSQNDDTKVINTIPCACAYIRDYSSLLLCVCMRYMLLFFVCRYAQILCLSQNYTLTSIHIGRWTGRVELLNWGIDLMREYKTCVINLQYFKTLVKDLWYPWQYLAILKIAKLKPCWNHLSSVSLLAKLEISYCDMWY